MTRGGPTSPLAGQHVRFIRYIPTKDGWEHDIRRGEFLERTDTGWRVRILDQTQELPEAEWSLYWP